MSLIPCPECAREISDQAPTCPHCGYPVANPPPATPGEPQATPPRRASRLRTGALILLLLTVVIIAGVIVGNLVGSLFVP